MLGLLPESLDQTTLLGVPSKFQLMFVSSTYRNTGLHYTYGSATLSAAYVGYLYLENHWVTLSYGCATLSAVFVSYLKFHNHLLTPNLWVSNVKFSLMFLASPVG